MSDSAQDITSENPEKQGGDAVEKDAVEQDSNQKDSTEAEKKSSGNEVVVNNDFRIFVNEPLPLYNKGVVKAYRATGGSRHARRLVALIADKSVTPCFASEGKYTNISNPNLCSLVHSGKVFWTPNNAETYCFIYEDVGEPYIKDTKKTQALGLAPDVVLSNIVAPMIALFRDFRNKEFVHGSIWPGNMFDCNAKLGQKISLGECLATPASSNMPALYEPIERAIADPMGRGLGDFSDDLYSFGASLAVMLRSEDPLKGLSEDKIIEYKIEKGSYVALLGKERLSGALLELLRGLLYDDYTQRWTFEDLDAWIDGRRLTPKQAPKRIKATRPIMFQDKKYIRPEVLAKDMHMDSDGAVKLIESNELEQWVERAIEDKIVKLRLEQSLGEIETYDRGSTYNARVTCSLSNALYPECPVRFQGINFTVQGFGPYLTQAYVNKANIEPFVDTMKNKFILPFLRETRSLDKVVLMSCFDEVRSALKKTDMNLGFERTLYVMNPKAPCLSPILDKYYVQTPRDMMHAFEALCKKSSKSTILFDRHIISFLSVKDKLCIDSHLPKISSKDPKERILGQLKVLSTMQRRLGLGNFPAIAQWVYKGLDPVFQCFHDSKQLENLKKSITKLAQDGDLQAMSAIFENPKIYEEDLSHFYMAMKEYQELQEEKEFIEGELSKGNKYGQNTGRQIASVISMIISFIIIVLSAYHGLTGG